MNQQAERILWSMAIPGFGQFLNHKYLKGITLILLELLINSGSHLNQIILLSFQGRIPQAIATTNYQWLMFYPCVYMFGIWDAYKDAGGTAPFAYLPFVLTAFFGTVGVIYSPLLRWNGRLLGPVWLPMLSAGIGLFLGVLLRVCLHALHKISKPSPYKS
ncbi:hypothetical protein NZD89_12860 [Alicyclobacillus fastidiosus]|uniref:Uncharacterized protein n=1 Tax=Alicyclobacillus fastidiosus TaxID=392011 RepID=A0ABY6ZMX1_9BACL|nr:hypothetical protein [Alicyclobacillus fastidiosus]WAH44187.1 hypothetical protein NZD89_12860 [Alicyclobacillus fastidiosus]GMA60501.1 hypothetical protein GCM10025859_09410 [Alicyclobacillus fastidiosus]